MGTPSSKRSFIDLVLVEPSAYWRIFALDHQAERFAVFHRSAVTRWTHYLGTPVILWALLVLTMGIHIGPVPLAAIVVVALTAWYLKLHPMVGIVGGTLVGLLAVLASWSSVHGVTSLHAGIALFVGATALNLSHAIEPVPPVLTGRGFEPFAVYWPRASWPERARLLGLNGFYLPFEIVSAPRLFAIHVLRALHVLGWRRAQGDDVDARAAAELRR